MKKTGILLAVLAAAILLKTQVWDRLTGNFWLPEKIPLSNDFAVSLFYDYGTKALTPDLILKMQTSTTV